MSSEHNLTGELATRQAFDPETKSFKSSIVGSTEMSIELSHQDGDSVYAHRPSITISNGIASCVGMSRACLFGEGTVSVSADDSGDSFYPLSVTQLVPFEICARRIKLVGSGKLVING